VKNVTLLQMTIKPLQTDNWPKQYWLHC